MKHRNSETPAMTTGLDLGDKFTYFHTLDKDGNLHSADRVPTTPEDML